MISDKYKRRMSKNVIVENFVKGHKQKTATRIHHKNILKKGLKQMKYQTLKAFLIYIMFV